MEITRMSKPKISEKTKQKLIEIHKSMDPRWYMSPQYYYNFTVWFMEPGYYSHVYYSGRSIGYVTSTGFYFFGNHKCRKLR
jgi:hypothetical protein